MMRGYRDQYDQLAISWREGKDPLFQDYVTLLREKLVLGVLATT